MTKKSLCPLCGGDKKKGKTIFSADLGTGVMVVRNVPATICDQCGEAWINSKTASKLELLSQDVRYKGAQVEVIAL